MIAETIKTLLGAELAGQVEALLKGKGDKGDDIDLIVGNDGSVVPSETHRQLQGEMTRLQKTTALKLGLGQNVHDPEDIISRLDLDALEMDDHGGLKSDLETLLQPIRESKPYLFKEPPAQAAAQQTPALNLQGAVPGQVGTQGVDLSVQQLNEAFGLKGE